MAQRTVALCDGKFIGIESIFTVVNGKQINIPDKLAALRLKSRNNELFCPCGCGSNLILVASEESLREQHFRLKSGEFNKDCQVVTESKRSVDSKIVLKCWLDDKLRDDGLESRVPIADISDTDRKYEFTFLSRTKAIGISYCHDRVNLSDEKLKILAENSAGIKLIHILDACNFKADGQYPEAEMKVQDVQGYCLLLNIGDGTDYLEAGMRGVFYAQNLDGLWEKIEFCNGKLSDYGFNDGEPVINGEPISALVVASKKKYTEKLKEEQAAREEARKRKEAYEKEQRELAEKRRIELQKQREEAERKWAEEEERRKLETEKRAQELREQQRIREEQRQAAMREAAQADEEHVKAHIDQQTERVVDSRGVRWIKCEFCGKVAPDSEFAVYGGINHINLGRNK